MRSLLKKVFLTLFVIILLAGAFYVGSMYPSAMIIPNLKTTMQKLENDLSSPEGLMRLVPELRNANGQFEIPNPTVDLAKYLLVRQSLLNVIEMALAKANMISDPYTYSASKHTPLNLPREWNANEVGFVTDVNNIPDFSRGGFGYVGKSFLNGVIPVKGTNNSFYTVPGSAVYMNLMPTSLSCVNRIMETSGLNGGTMMATSYALGGKDGNAYLIVNGCQNTAKTIMINNQQVLAPNASSFLGIQWVKGAAKSL